jgi:hypothetical protein
METLAEVSTCPKRPPFERGPFSIRIGVKSCNRKLSVCCNFRRSWGLRKPVRNNCCGGAGPKASSALAVVKRKPIFTVSATYIRANPAVTNFIDRRHRVAQDQNPLNQMVLADLNDGTPGKRHLHAGAATDVGDQDRQTRVDHGPQDSQSPGRTIEVRKT